MRRWTEWKEGGQREAQPASREEAARIAERRATAAPDTSFVRNSYQHRRYLIIIRRARVRACTLYPSRRAESLRASCLVPSRLDSSRPVSSRLADHSSWHSATWIADSRAFTASLSQTWAQTAFQTGFIRFLSRRARDVVYSRIPSTGILLYPALSNHPADPPAAVRGGKVLPVS